MDSALKAGMIFLILKHRGSGAAISMHAATAAEISGYPAVPCVPDEAIVSN